MTALRICMVTTFYPPFNMGGDGIAVQRLARALVQAGHAVTVVHDTDAYNTLSRGPRLELPVEGDDEGVRLIRLQSKLGALAPVLVQQLGRPVAHRRRLRALLRSDEWDVVHFHNVSLMGAPAVLEYPRGAITLYTAHEHWLVCPTHVLWRHRRERCDHRECLRCVLRHHRPPQLWRYTGALQRAIGGIDTVIALSEFSRDMHRKFGLKREMVVLPPFLPPVTAPATDDSSPHHRPYFFFAGRLEPLKGLDDVLEAFREFRDADLIVAGDGSARERWEAVAADLPHVRFIGQQAPEDVSRWQRHAIAALVPSVGYETFGMVLIEAMQVGTPVIARRIGPFPEIIAQAGTGELFASVEELTATLTRLAADPAHRSRLSLAAQKAAQRWSADVVVPAYVALIDEARQLRWPSPP